MAPDERAASWRLLTVAGARRRQILVARLQIDFVVS
jgi:hypothetical protein